jgi:hypothetical protein
MEPIYRLFNGAFIDLDKLVFITTNDDFDSVFEIKLEFSLRDHPFVILISKEEHSTDYCLAQLEVIVRVWKEYKSKTCKKKCSASAN